MIINESIPDKDIDLYENEDWSYQSLLDNGTCLKF